MSRQYRVIPSPVAEPVRRTDAGPWTIELLPASAYEVRYVATQWSIGFAFDSQRGTHAIGSDRLRPFAAMPNGLAFVPAGCDVFSASDAGGEYLLLKRNDGGSLTGDRAYNNLIDPQAIRLAQRMRNALLRASVNDDWEAWAIGLAERASQPDSALTPSGTSMTRQRLRLLDEYIDAGLDRPMSVQDMANLLGLSEGYFMRAFSQATGQSPHSYLIDRRVARARALLRNARASVADIAHACGFSSQAHLATTFRQRLGVSPSQLRD
ncbi:helix-turn-helix transcriptional regulator [Pseudomonas abietaniphila]|uniref:helix-turn-helix transcriptional regulator n=1 Tax=Pseudomonas abietaniphila TaxID=89065 RepID=UPI0007838D50|nr:AraC family transcriptional regulator [Pseudomonas abietaniphila]